MSSPCILSANAGSRTEIPSDVPEPERWAPVAPNILHWTFGGPKEGSAEDTGGKESHPSATERPDAEQQGARSFIVFFELGEAELTEEGRRIVRHAAAYAKQTGAPSIVITTFGRAPFGPASVNVGLSAPRAESVKADLVRHGIPSQSIDIAWGVEPQPLADLPYGPREPLNNRVEITVGSTEPET